MRKIIPGVYENKRIEFQRNIKDIEDKYLVVQPYYEKEFESTALEISKDLIDGKTFSYEEILNKAAYICRFSESFVNAYIAMIFRKVVEHDFVLVTYPVLDTDRSSTMEIYIKDWRFRAVPIHVDKHIFEKEYCY